MMRYRFAICFLPAIVIAFLITAPPAESADPRHPDPAPAPSILRVAMSGDYMPLHFIDQGNATGFEADVASALAVSLGRSVHFLSRDQMKGGALAAVVSGAADIALNAVTPTPERAEKVDFTAPIAALDYLVVTGKGNAAEDFAAACPRTIAVAAGPGASALQAAKPGQAVTVVKSTAAAVALVAEGKVDCALGEDVGLFLSVGETELQVIDQPVGISPIAMAVPKGQGRMYDEHLAKIGGQLKALRQKWFLQEPRAGLRYAAITLPLPSKKGKAAARYAAIRSTQARTKAKSGAVPVSRLEPGDIIYSFQPVDQAGAWIETSIGETRVVVAAGDLVNLDGPFFNVTRTVPETDPNEPCVDGPCGCVVSRPAPVNTVDLTSAGKLVLNGAFAKAVSGNGNVYARRKLARNVLQTLLDREMSRIVTTHAEDRQRFYKCHEECSAGIEEGDGCCDCEEPDEYKGISEAFEAIDQLLNSFADDPDPEVARRSQLAFCGFQKSHADILEIIMDSLGVFSRCET